MKAVTNQKSKKNNSKKTKKIIRCLFHLVIVATDLVVMVSD